MIKLIIASLVTFTSVYGLTQSTNGEKAPNEEAKAITACIHVLKIEEKKDPRNKGMSDICHMNTKSVKYWRCVEERLKKDESFHFATAQCDKKR
jgi:hypothetical protein